MSAATGTERLPAPAQSAQERRARWILNGVMIFGVFVAGLAFVYKIAEFIFTLNESSVQGFADVPVTVYFVVAAGWLCLLAWSFLSGQFKDVENTKCELLELEEKYEREGI